MIHFIVIMHFFVISAGAITLFFAWMQYKARKDQVLKWLFYTDLVFTINMVLDAIRIYISKNVTILSQGFWPYFHFIVYIFSIAIMVSSLKTIELCTQSLLLFRYILLFCLAFMLSLAITSANLLGILGNQYLEPISYLILLLCCIVYGFLSISSSKTKYRPITITYTIALIIYLFVYVITNLIPGMPSWVFKIPYTQIIFLNINILGLLFLLKLKAEHTCSESNITQTSIDKIKQLSEKYGLSPRELEIVSEIVEGKNNREIAEKLYISPNTVKNHAYNIYKKIGIKNRYELMSIMSQN